MRDDVKEYLDWLTSRGYSEFTVSSYRSDISLFSKFLEKQNISIIDVDEAIFSRFITQYGKERKPATVKRMYASVPKFYQFLFHRKVIKAYPFTELDFDRPKIKNTRPLERTYTEEEMLKIGEAVKKQKDPLLAELIVELLRSSSLRARELLALNYATLDLKTASGTTIRKGGNRWPIKFSKHAAILLQKYNNTHKADILKRNGLVFGINYQQEYRLLKKIRKGADLIIPLRPHKLRHYWATQMLEDHVDSRIIVKLGGWKSDNMLTTTYGHERDKHLTEEYEKSKVSRPIKDSTQPI